MILTPRAGQDFPRSHGGKWQPQDLNSGLSFLGPLGTATMMMTVTTDIPSRTLPVRQAPP